MKKSVLLSALVLLSASTFSFGALLQSLNKTQVMSAMQGKTITTIPLVTIDNQLVNNTFTGFFGQDGKAQAQFTNKPDNQPQTDQGTWMVKADGTMCVTWQHWNQNKPICLAVYKLKNGIVFINTDSKKFESMVLDDNIKSGNQVS